MQKKSAPKKAEEKNPGGHLFGTLLQKDQDAGRPVHEDTKKTVMVRNAEGGDLVPANSPEGKAWIAAEKAKAAGKPLPAPAVKETQNADKVDVKSEVKAEQPSVEEEEEEEEEQQPEKPLDWLESKFNKADYVVRNQQFPRSDSRITVFVHVSWFLGRLVAHLSQPNQLGARDTPSQEARTRVCDHNPNRSRGS